MKKSLKVFFLAAALTASCSGIAYAGICDSPGAGAYFTAQYGFPTSIDTYLPSTSYTCWDFYNPAEYTYALGYTGTFDKSYLIPNANPNVGKTTQIYFNTNLSDYWDDAIFVYERIPGQDQWEMTAMIDGDTNATYTCKYNTGDVIIRVKKTNPDDYFWEGYRKGGIYFYYNQY
jgi:hypothetical protein